MPACLGLDYGLRRIGIAACDAEASLAFAIGTHVEGRDGSVMEMIAALVTDRSITTIVVGLPLTTAGEEAELARKARAFAEKLAAKIAVDIVMWDERYSSQEADRWLQQASRPSREDRDALAAEIILQSYLDSLQAGPQGSES
ncbi:MAG: Holliday junction resolvase RuvX [Candidatus Krumholzibacteria bacterium]|nr:Holliday junction resolvase RuvX [Candidatus Krumholzibacteria bacterium]